MGIYGEEKMRELQKSFVGMFYRKVLWESFSGKFCRKFYRKVLRESFSESFTESFTGKFYEKSFTGEMGNQVWIETWKVVDPSQLQ